MPPTRRAILALFATIGVAALGACSPDPVVTGDPSEPWIAPPDEPVQSDAAAQATAWTVGLRVLAGQAGDDAWASSAVARADAHLDRLLAIDPLVPGTERVFTTAEPSPVPVADEAELAALIDDAVDRGLVLFADLAQQAGTQPERLLYASLGASAASNRVRLAPVAAGGGEPIRFPDTTVEASMEVALTHVWALLGGLEVALGRLPDGDTRQRAAVRINRVRELRNQLRADLTAPPPAQEISYELPTAMDTPERITAGLATLEHRLLDALARLVAAGAEVSWFGQMTSQVSEVQAWGGALPRWPGWTSA